MVCWLTSSMSSRETFLFWLFVMDDEHGFGPGVSATRGFWWIGWISFEACDDGCNSSVFWGFCANFAWLRDEE